LESAVYVASLDTSPELTSVEPTGRGARVVKAATIEFYWFVPSQKAVAVNQRRDTGADGSVR
jgi:hypothetical protein